MESNLHVVPNSKAVKKLLLVKILCGAAATTLFIQPMVPTRKVVACQPLLDVVKITLMLPLVPTLRVALVKILNSAVALMMYPKLVDLNTRVSVSICGMAQTTESHLIVGFATSLCK